MRETIRWLHLTDLHVGMGNQDWLWPRMRDKFRDDLKKIYGKAGPWDLVLFTGDLVQKGTEYGDLDKILDEIWMWFQELGCHPKLLAVPGNHDLKRPAAKKAAVKMLEQWANDPEVPRDFWAEGQGEFREVVHTAFADYSKWWQETKLRPADIQSGALPGDFSWTFEKGGVRLGIVGLNTAFLQLTDKPDYEGRLVVHPRQFQAACGKDGVAWAKSHHACLLMTHHPPAWLNRESHEYLDGEILESFCLHLCGHNHVTEVVKTLSGGAEDAHLLWLGRSLFGLEKADDGKLDRSYGYAAGELRVVAANAVVQFMPRRREQQGNRWNLIPDSSVELPDNHERTREFPVKLLVQVQMPRDSRDDTPEEDAEDDEGESQKVFISYSHDSVGHTERVLQLANQLRAHGIDVELDQYQTQPHQGWARWCEERLRPDNSRFVLVICTRTYLARVEGKVPANEGRGVYWEGSILYNYLYDAKGNRRFLLVLLADESEACIPVPLRSYNRYRIHQFELADRGYEDLYRTLTGQPRATKPDLGQRLVLNKRALGPATASGESIRLAQSLPQQEVRARFEPPPQGPVTPPRGHAKPQARFVMKDPLESVCQTLRSDKEPFVSMRKLILAMDADRGRDVTVGFLERILKDRLMELMSRLRCWLEDDVKELDDATRVREIVDIFAVAGLDSGWVEKIVARFKEATHIEVPIWTDIHLSEAVLTALLDKAVGSWVRERWVALQEVESPSTEPQGRRADIRKRLADRRMGQILQRNVGESEEAYERRYRDFINTRLLLVLKVDREDHRPYVVLYCETAEQLKADIEADRELWDQILKLEQKESCDGVILDEVELGTRLQAIFTRLDQLGKKRTSGAQI